MNTETFFKQFELFADAPNGIAKLRELILQLAVQGKLVPQNPDDEPADVLLERIKAEKKRLVKEGKIKKSKKLPDINQDEISFELPDSWKWCRLTEIVSILGDGLHGTPVYDLTGEYYFINGNNLSNGVIEIKGNTKRVSLDEYLKCKRNLNENTVLVSINGTIGNVAFYNLEKVVLGKSACYFNLLSNIDKYYIAKLINSNYFLQYAFASATGTTIKNVSLKTMRGFLIPLPPLAEQYRIVEKVDRLMELCDKLETQQQQQHTKTLQLGTVATSRLTAAKTPEAFKQHWQNISNNFDLIYSTPENIKQLRQTILQLAVMGKLVPQNPDDESASVLLAKIKAEKEKLIKEGKIKKSKKLKAIAPDEIEYLIPKQWNWSRLADICEIITDGTHQTPRYTENGRMFLSAQNIKPFQFMPEKHRFVSEEDYQGYIKNKKPELEDILMTRVGAGIGETAVIDQKFDFAIYVSIALIRPFKKFLNPHYLAIWLNSPTGSNKSHTNTYGKGVSQGNLNLGLIRQFVVSIPPLAEQHRIVAKVNQLMIYCDELEAKLTQSLSDKEKLIDTAVYQLLSA